MGDGNTRFRQPPRPPVRPFPNPTPQQGGLVKRLPSWSSRRATPHSLTAGDGSLPYADSIPAPDVMDNVPVGTFKKVVPADAVAEIPLFHQDIPPPPPYTNCIKIYLSGNTTKKLPNLRQNAVVPSMTSSAIPSRYSVPLRPAPPPPMQHEFTPVQPSLTPPAPYRLDAIVQNRAAPPPPLSLTPAPQSMRRVRPANAPSRPSGAGRPPPPPPRSRPPTTNAPAPPLPSQFPPSDDDDLLRVNWAREKLNADFQEATLSQRFQDCGLIQQRVQLELLVEQLHCSRDEQDYNEVLSVINRFCEHV